MILSTEIETNRLVLRTLDQKDATQTYLSWLVDPEVNKYLEIRFANTKTLKNLKTFIKTMNDSPDNLLLGIFIKKTSQHIGNIKLGPIVYEHQRSEIGFLIGEKSQWGKGYACEAIAELSEYAINDLGIVKLTAGCYESNTGSRKALIKAGYTVEAKLPSYVISDGNRIDSYLFGYQK